MEKKTGHANRDDLPRPILPGRGDLVDLYYFAWDLARSHIACREGLASPYYMDEGFEPDKVWQWDTCFMALFCRYAFDLFPGIESLDNFYAVQREDGYISMTHQVDTGEDSYKLDWGRINPPLLSWVEWETYLVTGDRERLRRVLAPLVKYDDWVEKNRRRADGSYWFSDCGSSGMDNSPRTSRRDHTGHDTNFVDLASQQALSASCIARIAEAIDDRATADRYRRLHAERCRYVNENLWCERHGFYYDRFYDDNFSNCKTAASFWPMLAEAASDEQARSLADHLRNPLEFARPHPVPTLSYDNSNYRDDGHYWHGGVWAPTNYMIVRGLMKYGLHAPARSIAEKHLDMLYRVWRDFSPHTLWECYAPEEARPGTNERDELCRKDFVGWTGLGPIAMLIETILGIEVDYPARKVSWHSSILTEHGVENLRFGEHRIALRAGARRSPEETPAIRVDADCELALEFIPYEPS